MGCSINNIVEGVVAQLLQKLFQLFNIEFILVCILIYLFNFFYPWFTNLHFIARK